MAYFENEQQWYRAVGFFGKLCAIALRVNLRVHYVVVEKDCLREFLKWGYLGAGNASYRNSESGCGEDL